VEDINDQAFDDMVKYELCPWINNLLVTAKQTWPLYKEGISMPMVVITYM
jgi:hypothetical protein